MADPVRQLIEDAKRLADQVLEGEVAGMESAERLSWEAEAAAVLQLAANELRVRVARH